VPPPPRGPDTGDQLTLQLPATTPHPPASPITVAGRALTPSPVFDTYWRFAAARHALYQARLAGHPGPWTRDPILARHRFTNAFRAADRVSQHLISQVIYAGDPAPAEVVFRTLLFKSFNRISTWQLLHTELGEISWARFDLDRYDLILGRAAQAGQRLYSPAYVIPPPPMGAARKHTNHLRLLHHIMAGGLVERLLAAGGMAETFRLLHDIPSFGDFLAYQHTVDLGYSEIVNFDEDDFVVAGPGARDGIRKCFGPAADGIEHEIIRYVTEHQEQHFARLGLRFDGLLGRRRLHLVDCQNLFCEVDKYARVAHPDIAGHTGRSRIKQTFQPLAEPLTAWFPPRWGLNGPAGADSAAAI
jgi:hypothetical protein